MCTSLLLIQFPPTHGALLPLSLSCSVPPLPEIQKTGCYSLKPALCYCQLGCGILELGCEIRQLSTLDFQRGSEMRVIKGGKVGGSVCQRGAESVTQQWEQNSKLVS